METFPVILDKVKKEAFDMSVYTACSTLKFKIEIQKVKQNKLVTLYKKIPWIGMN